MHATCRVPTSTHVEQNTIMKKAITARNLGQGRGKTATGSAPELAEHNFHM
jgi:hypothetical protein